MGRAGLQAEVTVHTGLAAMPGGHVEALSGPFSAAASQAQLSPQGAKSVESGSRLSWVCIPAPLPLAGWFV